jgi:hypothetical protein
VALEVGTVPTRDVFNALRKDNWLHCFAGRARDKASEIRQEIRAAFFPDESPWKRVVFAHASEVVHQGLKAMR